MIDYLLIKSEAELTPYEDKVLGTAVIGIDTETTGLDPHTDTLQLIQIAASDNLTLVIDCFQFLPEGLPFLICLLTSNTIKVFQNAKFDLQFFMKLGIGVTLPLFCNGGKRIASLCQGHLWSYHDTGRSHTDREA